MKIALIVLGVVAGLVVAVFFAIAWAATFLFKE